MAFLRTVLVAVTVLCVARGISAQIAPAVAPAAGPTAAVTAGAQVTDLCTPNTCLRSVPTGCGGNCFLTAAPGDTTYCAKTCVAAFNTTTVKGCLQQTAAGSYYLDLLLSLDADCQKIAAAAAAAAAADKNVTTNFPCAANITGFNNEQFLACDPNVCTTTCQAQLSLLPAACQTAVAAKSAGFKSAIAACTASPAPLAVANATAPSGLGTRGSGSSLIGSNSTTAPSSGSGNGAGSVQSSAMMLISTTLAAAGALLLL